MISLDANLALEEDSVVGNVRNRHIEYAKSLENLYVVVKTSRAIKRRIIKIKDNIFIYPTSSLSRYLFFFDAYKLASKICQKNKISLIITQDPFVTGLIGWLLKKKFNISLNMQIVADMIDNRYFIKESSLNFFLNKLAKRLIHKADTIQVCTKKERGSLVSLGINEDKVYCVPFFVDFAAFEQRYENSIRQLILDGKFEKIILSVNRLVEQKSIETLIRAIPYTIKKYPKCLFLIVGSGPKEKDLRKLASDLGVLENIRFQGPVVYNDLARYYHAADIFAITSHYEGTCMALQDAMAAGKPVISTPHTGAQDVIRDGYTGFIVEFDDYIGLAKKILYLLENDNLARDMGNRAHDFIVEHFKKEHILSKYYNMWNETIERNDKVIK